MTNGTAKTRPECESLALLRARQVGYDIIGFADWCRCRIDADAPLRRMVDVRGAVCGLCKKLITTETYTEQGIECN